MLTYLKRRWENTSADHPEWGHSWWFFEVDARGTVLRQIERYASGPTLRYNSERLEDEFGGLAERPIPPHEQASYEGIEREEFEAVWGGSRQSAE